MSSTESQPRLIAAKFAGQRGYQFTEWAKEFLDAAAGKGDEDASWADCYLGQDPQAGLNAAQLRRRTQRRRESYSALLQHMDDDSLKAVIRAEAGPLAVNPQDRSNGSDTSLMPTEFAFLGDRIASGLMPSRSTAVPLAIWWTTHRNSPASRPPIHAGVMSVLLMDTLFELRTWVRWTSP